MAQRNQVLSLFGASPEQIRQRQLQEQQQQVFSQTDPYMRLGTALGTGLGRLFGGKSEEVRQAEQMQQALQGVNINNPEALREVARTVQAFAPERSLQILDRATQLENQTLAREADELQIEAARYKLEQARTTDPLRVEALEQGNKIKDAKLRALSRDETERQQALEDLETQRTNTIKFLRDNELDDYAQLVEDKVIEPSAAINAWNETQKDDSLNITEVGNYTIGDRAVIGALDTDKGIFYELSPDGGWIRRPADQVTQGKPSTSETSIKQGRTVAGQVLEDYETQFDALVNVGIFSDSAEEEEAQRLTGIENITSKEGKQELYRLAEQIFANNPGITEREALERALKGERVTSPSSTQTQQTPPPTDPYANTPIKG